MLFGALVSSFSNVPRQKDLIVLNDVHRVFAIDALASSHPLSSKEEDIQRPEQISELFDAISYSKVALHFVSCTTPEQNVLTTCKTYLFPSSGCVRSENVVGFPH